MRMIHYYLFQTKRIKCYYTTSAVVFFMRFRIIVSLLCMMNSIAVITDVRERTNDIQPDIVYERCGFTSNVRFATWFGTLFTDSPVLFPTNDTELIHIVTTASSKSCKVRVIGGGHSEDGIVMQKSDQLYYNVIVISLQYYLPDDPLWHENLNTDKPSVRMCAGSSLFDMIAYVRPKGYLGDTGTFGRFFALGGVYLNPSTKGGWFNKTRLAPTVLAVRVLHANGTIAIYNETNDSVRPFQGSMGLLGIVTALEIRLRKDTGLLMTFQKLAMNHHTYSVEKVKSFYSNIVLNNDGATFFYWGRIDTLVATIMKNDGNPNFDPSTTTAWYDYAKANGLFQQQAMNTQFIFTKLGTYIARFTQLMGWIVHNGGVTTLEKIVQEQSITPNDGFLGGDFSVPNFEQVAYSIHCQTAFCIDEVPKLIDVTRKFLKSNVYHDKGSRFLDLAFLNRIFIVRENDLLLDHFHQPGYYLESEIESPKRNDRIKYSYVFKQIEDLWHTTFPNGTVHHGKAYGYGPILSTTMANGKERPMEQNEWIPFQNETIVSSVYTNETRELFLTYMDQYDPNGTFRAGSALHLLGLTPEKYTVKQYNNEECYDGAANNVIETSVLKSYEYNKNIGCFSNCCDNRRSSSICHERRSYKMGNTCTNDCDCDPNARCRITLSSLTTKICATTFFS